MKNTVKCIERKNGDVVFSGKVETIYPENFWDQAVILAVRAISGSNYKENVKSAFETLKVKSGKRYFSISGKKYVVGYAGDSI